MNEVNKLKGLYKEGTSYATASKLTGVDPLICKMLWTTMDNKRLGEIANDL